MEYEQYVDHPLTRKIAEISGRPVTHVARLAVQITREQGGSMIETLLCGVLAAMLDRAAADHG